MEMLRGGTTRERLIAATLESLREDGYAGTSIRAIARRAGVNSALISYYFGGLNGVLLAALDHSSQERMTRYRSAMEGATTPEEFMRVATMIYREDVEAGHITVFTELVGGSLAHPELRAEIVKRTEPWIEFVQIGVEKVLEGSPLEGVLPTEPLANAILAFYLGVNFFTLLEDDRSRTEGVFEFAEQFAPLISQFLRTGPISRAVIKGFTKRTLRRGQRKKE